jgi:membrane protease YdiL (CAAX protease family)
VGALGLVQAASIAAQALPDADPAMPVNPMHDALAGVNLMLLLAAPVALALLWMGDVIRPGSPGRHAARDVRPLAWYVWFLAAISLYPAIALGTAISMGIARALDLPADDHRTEALAQTGALLAAGGVGIWIFTHLARSAPRAGLGATRRDVLAAMLAFVLAMPVLVASSVASTFLWSLSGGEVAPLAHETLQELVKGGGDPWSIPVILAAVVGAPLVEEMMFRAGLQSAVLRAVGDRWTAILFTSIVFACIHLGAVPAYGLVPLFVLSVAMGLAYERTGRLGVPILMHAMFNALNVAMAFTIG